MFGAVRARTPPEPVHRGESGERDERGVSSSTSRAAVSAAVAAVLKVGTSHTRPVTLTLPSKGSHRSHAPAEAGDGQLEGVQADTPAAARGDRDSRSALTLRRSSDEPKAAARLATRNRAAEAASSGEDRKWTWARMAGSNVPEARRRRPKCRCCSWGPSRQFFDHADSGGPKFWLPNHR